MGHASNISKEGERKMRFACRVFAGALLVVMLGTGMYVFAAEVYEAIQDIRTEVLLEEALESADTELLPEEAALEAFIEVGVELVDGEEYLQPERKRELEVDSAKVSERINDGKGLRAVLKNKGYYADDINISLMKYIDASIMYSITDEENDYIMNLVGRGYDFEKLVDVYVFLQMTHEDLSMLRDIYDYGANTYAKHWIDTAYENITGADVLSTEDVREYVGNGIVIEDVLAAYELGLRTNTPIRNLLDYRLDGGIWGDLAGEAFYGENNLREINNIFDISGKLGLSPNEIAVVGEYGLWINDDAVEEYARKNDEVQAAYELEEIVFENDEIMIAEAKRELRNIDGAVVEELIEQGYRIRDIKESMKGAEERKDLTSDAISEIVKGGAGR